MTSSVSTIVDELLALDPSLTPHRAEMDRIVTDFLSAKPDAHLREEFTQELLAKLQTTLLSSSLSPAPPLDSARDKLRASEVGSPLLSMLPRLLFFGGGTLAGALIAVLVTTTLPKGTPPPAAETMQEEADNTPLGREAFGNLTQTTPSARPQSGGGGGYAGVSMEGAKIAADSMILPPGEMTIVEYAYGGDIPLPSGDIEVLRRRQAGSAGNGSTILSSSPLARLFDISRLGNLSAQNIMLTQEGREPLSLNVDFLDGSVWISRTMDYQTRPDANCTDEACFRQFRLKESDMLTDDELVRIMQDFVAELGIDTSSYGEPVINDWKTWFTISVEETGADLYFPEALSVVLPLLIEGKTVYEEYGEPYGITFMIDVRRKQVMSVSNLRTHAFDSSSYAAASDLENVKKALKQGASAMWMPEEAKKVEATLEAPVEAYLHTYQWNESDGTSKELFVPALAFPTTTMPEGALAKKRVVLPLAAELIERILKPDFVGIPMPLGSEPRPEVSE